jgi:plasmid stabilization system protein ParE
MAFPIKIVPRAAREIAEAWDWWQANRQAAPTALDEELRRAFALISEQPSVGARALNTKLGGVRRVYLSRVHYHLYYRFRSETEIIEVLALWHASRGSGPDV